MAYTGAGLSLRTERKAPCDTAVTSASGTCEASTSVSMDEEIKHGERSTVNPISAYGVARVNSWLTHPLEYGAKSAPCPSWMAEGEMTTARRIVVGLAMALSGAATAGERCSAIDAQTLACGRERVRVEGLRGPALEEPGGREARQRLQRRIQSGELVIDRTGRDKWGRTLGRAYVNGKRITQLDVDTNTRRGRTSSRG